MITAKEARNLMVEDESENYLASIEKRIRAAAKENYNCFDYAWDKRINNTTWKTIIQKLVDNGFKVNTIPASHYYEFGAIEIKW